MPEEKENKIPEVIPEVSSNNLKSKQESQRAFKYISSEDLTIARNVAGFLSRPLLLTGEPGAGKTTYANHLSVTESRKLFVFNTKSVSQAQDLFYTYDAVAHFANSKKSALEFITLEALGKSLVNAFGTDNVRNILLKEETSNYQLQLLRSAEDCQTVVNRFLKDCCNNPSIVLIDEVDKAPRDFPNDILNEIDNYEFFIKEIGLQIRLDKSQKEITDRIFVLITSNFDKNLPDAFLRRCLFHEIEFPASGDLVKIIKSHLPDISVELLEKRMEEFYKIRKREGITKPPSTSEFIDCLKWLEESQSLDKELQENQAALTTLLKKKADVKLIYKKPSGAQQPAGKN